MTRAWQTLKQNVRWKWPLIFTKNFWFWMPRPGYCMRCGFWCWLTNERPVYSAHDGAFICEECAIENDIETEAAWAEYYSGRL